MSEESPKYKSDELTPGKIIEDLRLCHAYKRDWLKEAKEDIRFTLGKQWEDDDVQTLKELRVRALTINKIRPNVNLLAGIEAQNRSEIKAFPEGKEDSLEAEVATSLTKNAMKQADGDYKISQQFEHGIVPGEAFLEPFLDYTEDILNGKLGLRLADMDAWYVFPGWKEYDLSDAKCVIKVTCGLSDDDLKFLYPKADSIIDKIGNGKVSVDGLAMEEQPEVQTKGYNDGVVGSDDFNPRAGGKDLVEYYYKKQVKHWYVADRKFGKIQPANSKEEAEGYLQKILSETPERAKDVQIFTRYVPEIWLCAIVGTHEEFLYQGQAWSYPRYKSYPLIPYFARLWLQAVDRNLRKLSVQGIVRDMKDQQREINKRRTQELRILNTSANSGWIVKKGSVNKDHLEEMGAVPGVVVEFEGDMIPQRINPAQLPAAHEALADIATKEIREASGINTESLAIEETQNSGRAIALRQKQGLVMVQKLFDHLSFTKRILGRFILSQLGQIFTVETALQVMGDAWAQQNFQKPVMAPVIGPNGQPVMDQRTNQPAMQPQISPQTGQPVMQPDPQAAMQFMNQVLTDSEAGKYNIAIGETVNSETIKFGNYQMLLEMAGKGIPVPPDVIVEESLLSEGSKAKIISAIENQQAMAAATAKTKPAPGK